MKSKDELKKRSIILPKPPAIQEMDDIPGTISSSSIATTATSSSKIQEMPSSLSTITKATKEGITSTIVPPAGKEDIALRSRQLPCPNGTLGIIVEVDMPNHVSMGGVTLDVVLPDKLIIHSKSQGQIVDQGKEYHAEVDMPNEPLDLDNIRAEFNKSKRTLRVYTIKKKRK